MSPKRHKAQWWQLYLGLPLLCSLFLIEMRFHITTTEHTILQLGILALIFVFMQAWIRANSRSLMEAEMDSLEKQGYGVRVYQLPAAEPAKGAGSGSDMRLSYGEVKGVLSTTFEVDFPEPLEYVDSGEVAMRKD